MKDLIPQDLAARATARGLKLERKGGQFIARRGKLEEYSARTIVELRRWLQSSESLPIRTV